LKYAVPSLPRVAVVMSSEGDRSEGVYGRPSRLPFYKHYSVKPLTKNYPIDPTWAWEACGSKIITGGGITRDTVLTIH
jgi:hypothetical protein